MSHFNVPLIVWAKSQDSVHKPQFFEEKRKESRSGSNQGPSAYQPSALPPGHTGSRKKNTELKRSPFKAWNRSVYCHTYYAYRQGFLPCLFLPSLSIHLHFFQNLFRVFLCWLWLTHGSCVGLHNKIGHPARGRFSCWVHAEYK